MNQPHTPTPWIADQAYSSKTLPTVWFTNILGIKDSGAICQTIGGTKEISEANAAAIVNAVNEYEIDKALIHILQAQIGAAASQRIELEEINKKLVNILEDIANSDVLKREPELMEGISVALAKAGAV